MALTLCNDAPPDLVLADRRCTTTHVHTLQQELHESNLTLVEGSAFSEQDLISRAGLSGSLGAMVLADRCAG
jgi:hypothetical protein